MVLRTPSARSAQPKCAFGAILSGVVVVKVVTLGLMPSTVMAVLKGAQFLIPVRLLATVKSLLTATAVCLLLC